VNEDFADLESLWRQEPDPEEQRIFRSLARATSRRAKLLQYGEILLALFLVAGVLATLFLAPRPATVALAILLAASLGWSSWKRHNLAQVAMMLDRSSREAFVASAVQSARARLRRSNLGLALILPGFFLGIAWKTVLSTGGLERLADLGRSLMQPNGLAALALILIVLVYFGYANLRLRREFRRLEELQREYRDEAERDREGKI
jgi:hypothetical protein